MKKVLSLLLISAILLPLCSCMDAREVNSWAFPYMIGVDKGVKDTLRYTILIPTLKEPKQGDSSGEGAGHGESTTISIDCPTISSGLNQMNAFLSRWVNYTHAEMLIIGEDLAKEGVAGVFEGMRMARQIRMDLSVAVVRGEASEFIESFRPVLGKSIPGVITGLMNASENTGLIEQETFLHMLEALKSDDMQATCTLGAVNDFSNYLPEGSSSNTIKTPELLAGELARKGGSPAELLGTAVFNGDKLSGELNLRETRAMLMMKGEYISGSITIEDPLDNSYNLTSFVTPKKGPQISVSLSDKKPVINIKIFLEGTVQTQESSFDYDNSEMRKILENAYAQFILKSITDTIRKCQGYGSDIFGFGDAAKRNFLTIPEWENYGWRDKFPEAAANIEVSFNMQRTGILVENNPVQRESGRQ